MGYLEPSPVAAGLRSAMIYYLTHSMAALFEHCAITSICVVSDRRLQRNAREKTRDELICHVRQMHIVFKNAIEPFIN
jgi:hypothetical protein